MPVVIGHPIVAPCLRARIVRISLIVIRRPLRTPEHDPVNLGRRGNRASSGSPFAAHLVADGDDFGRPSSLVELLAPRLPWLPRAASDLPGGSTSIPDLVSNRRRRTARGRAGSCRDKRCVLQGDVLIRLPPEERECGEGGRRMRIAKTISPLEAQRHGAPGGGWRRRRRRAPRAGRPGAGRHGWFAAWETSAAGRR